MPGPPSGRDQVAGSKVEQLRRLVPRLLPPAVEVPGRRHLGRDAAVVEVEERLVVDHQAAAPGPAAPAPRPRSSSSRFSRKNRCRVVQSPSTRACRMNSSRAAVGVDPRVTDPPVRRRCGTPYRVTRSSAITAPAAAVPVRLAVGPLDQVRRPAARPTRARSRPRSGPTAGGLDQLGGHHPARRLAGQRRARERARTARRGPRGTRAARCARVGVRADVRQQAGQQRRAPLGHVGRVGAAARPARAAAAGASPSSARPGAAGRTGPATPAPAGSAGTRAGTSGGRRCRTALRCCSRR